MKRDNKGDEFNLSGDFRGATVNIKTRVMWIGVGLALLAVALIVASLVFNIGPLKSLVPDSQHLHLLWHSPATEGQSLIIVADFEDRSGGKYQGIDPASTSTSN